MNVANLDLCKALYEVSGWEPDDENFDTWYIKTDEYEHGKTYDTIAPKYTLGYLLRKLPLNWSVSTENPGRYIIHYYNIHKGEFKFIADTPEDCATKLATELFRQGILKKGL